MALNSAVGFDRSPMVLLNATQKVKCLKEVGHFTKSFGHTQSTLVSHFKSVLLKDLITRLVFTFR